MTRWLVVGGGMRGIMAASVLAKGGHEVTLLDGAPMLGGVMCSSEWDGLYIDKGCHLLDFSHTPSGQLYREILGDRMHPVEVRYASINRGIKSDGIAVPDMSQFADDERRGALDGLEKAISGKHEEARNLSDALVHRYGLVAGEYAARCVCKMTGHDADTLAPEALETMPMLGRMRLGPDAEMEQLKEKSPEFDERLAASSQGNRWRFYEDDADFGHRNAYPSEKGMRGFCEAAATHLQGLGVRLTLGSPLKKISPNGGGVEATTANGDEIRADKCYWAIPSSMLLRTQGQDDPLAAVARPASILLYTFRVPPDTVADFTYLHDYSEGSLMFRGSTPGVYGDQRDADGNTYVCAEIPALMNGEVWSNAEDHAAGVWEELQKTGVVAEGTTYAAMRVDRAPVAYMLAGLGWQQARSAHDSLLEPYRKYVMFGGAGAFGKSAILDSVHADLEGHTG